MNERIRQLYEVGQSIWYDYIQRSFIESGELQDLVDAGVSGMTSNPTIFDKAITGSSDYDDAMRPLAVAGCTVPEIYESLVLDDISRAADILRPVYDRTGGKDGYVSLEVNPELARDTQGTIRQAKSLFKKLGRPNIMIKVPATPEGVPAVEALIGDGVNINVTLVFSIESYRQIALAFIRGLEAFAEAGGDPGKVASVASFFVSRVDTAVDKALQAKGIPELQGQIAVANAKVAYALFQVLFSGPRWDALAEQGARPQRVLWASTSTKNPAYSDTLYVDSLIGDQTVNTMPPQTLNAWLEHGSLEAVLDKGLDSAHGQLNRLAELGVDIDDITDQLQVDGVNSFAASFDALLEGIAAKREKLLLEGSSYYADLDEHTANVNQALFDLASHNVLARIWQEDYTVWRKSPDEIANRLGWLTIAERIRSRVGELEAFADSIRQAGYTDVLLLGMGGSSLAPEVFRKTFGVEDGFLDLSVLDSTDPGAVLAQAHRLEPAKTLFIVATKSGSTVETLSFFKYFYNWTAEALGEDKAGAHFVAITDPGSNLVGLADRFGFRRTFLNDPNIGGRYSALSYVGLVPAALLGIDLERLLSRAQEAAMEAAPQQAGKSRAARLGTAMGELALAGRDKLTLILSPSLESFGDWVEQLVAESTGKSGKGILPVVGEALGKPETYGQDRFFVSLELENEDVHAEALAQLEAAGHPLVRMQLQDIFDLGGQFFLWELATAIAGARMDIHPFNQPNVEAAKKLASRMVAQYKETGSLPQGEAFPPEAHRLRDFLGQVRPGSYVTLQAFIMPTEAAAAALEKLRLAIRARTGAAVTAGFGPRYLHSTGQLHKGDAGRGLFVQFTSEVGEDASIPNEAGKPGSSISFGVLRTAQALGDFEALRTADPPRPVIRFQLGMNTSEAIERLADGMEVEPHWQN